MEWVMVGHTVEEDMVFILTSLRFVNSLPAGRDRVDALQRLLSSAALLRTARPGNPLWPSLLELVAAEDS